MARARKSHTTHEEKTKPTRHGVQPPYDHRPGRNQYVIYCDYHREDLDIPKVLILGFNQLYSAKFFMDLVIGDEEYKWVKPVGSRECIKIESGIRISMDPHDIKRILDYEPTEQEAEWDDEQVRRHVSRFKYGKAPESRGSADNDSDSGGSSDKPRGKKLREKRPPKEAKVRIDKTGMVTANDIAKGLGVEGREVRGVLRALKLEKPEGGWAFDKKTADEIREKVKKGLKDAATKKGKK